ncbi:class I SAM-dependent methyltransferase [Oscillatoria sp. FACHB-1406]|uniref:class I SAM-dependent methyltransferase n=1 Tax=Oscillatoria sp. FACHB-1406 TaxID=2692846 RepID=UPI0016826D22|nr:class I SAM-dependent methyltransferase [Oscillatoria sp. FACHB-1406]MBD2579636.1 methyltransferase domain-containing protein [Oscillatoria sp. FACHB-1406]
MFPDYKDIFNARGIDYHQAMMEYPLARQLEFKNIISISDLEDNQTVGDLPSGGCYLNNFVKKKVKTISVETSVEFARNAKESENNLTITCEDISKIPLLSETLDRAISLAGSHHLPSQPAFYREVHRLLKPGGLFCLADVREGSGVDGFLNVFVDRYNSMGHQGEFLNQNTTIELEAAGFEILYASPIPYTWNFNSVEEMAYFCKRLFYIDRATEQQVIEAIEQYLGYQVSENQCRMNWELFFFKALKKE